MPLEVDQDRPVVDPTVEGEIIYSQHPWRWCRGRHLLANQPEQRIRTATALHVGQTPSHPRSRFTAQRKAQHGQCLGQLDGTTCIRLDDAGQPLGKDPSGTVRLLTKESAQVQL